MNAPQARQSYAWIWIALVAVGLALSCIGAAAAGVVGWAMYSVEETRESAIRDLEETLAREEQARREAEERMEAERAAAEAARQEAEARAAAEHERALAAQTGDPPDPLAGLEDPPPRRQDGQGISISELPPTPVPRVAAGAADVRGSLSSEVIRRVVRRHLNQVRFCYEQELARNPAREGRVVVSFVISPSGSVQSSTVASSTLGSATAEACVANAVRRWTFPSPEGGVVMVNYPFDFRVDG